MNVDQESSMTLLTSRRPPVLFAVSGAHALAGIRGPVVEANEARGIVVVTVRSLDRAGAAALVGPHVLSPSYLPATPLEERVIEVLRVADVDVPVSQRVPSALALPAGLTGTSIPIVVITLDLALARKRLERIGIALRALREEGIVLAGIAHDGAMASAGEMLAIVTVLLGTASEDDRVVRLGTLGGGLGFVLMPELDDAVGDAESCSFWNADAAGEMPLEIVEQLRPFLVRHEDGDNQDMKKKPASAISITRFDKARLMRLLRTLEATPEEREEIEDLEHELERGTEVDSSEVAPDVVTMNSTVRVTDLDAQTTHLYTIVFPSDADFEKGRISILSPLGTALLGYRAGDVVAWEMPRGTRRLRIEELVYQPEAAGDFHL